MFGCTLVLFFLVFGCIGGGGLDGGVVVVVVVVYKNKKVCGRALDKLKETLSVWPHHIVNSLTVGDCIGGGRFFIWW